MKVPTQKATGRPILTGLNLRRWQLFKANARGFVSAWIFLVLFVLSLFSNFLANDRPLLVSYKDDYYYPVFKDYPE